MKKSIILLPTLKDKRLKTLNLKVYTLAAALGMAGFIQAQSVASGTNKNLLGQRNVITTSVPFLTITPDAKSAGMGDAGCAADADANSIHWNVGKLSFIEKKAGVSLSAAPWLRQLVPDVWFYYLSGYNKFGKDDRSTLAASLRYFTLGEIQFTDEKGDPMGTDQPQEFAIDVAYSQKLSDKLGVGVAMRFINSRLVARGVYNGVEIKPGIAGAGDIGIYYKDKTKLSGKKVDYSFGANISNMGSKITYTTDANRDFMPANLRLGTQWKFDIDDYNQLSILVDFNKLLVPTPQYAYLKTADGKEDSIDQDGNSYIIGRELDDSPVVAGLFKSFGDAPGGFKEEMKEITTSIGLEYWYDKQFAVRAGYFNEADTKGGRKYATFGIGLRYNVFGIDAAYLQPFTQRHPLQNTIRFSLLFDIDAFKNQSEKSKPVVKPN